MSKWFLSRGLCAAVMMLAVLALLPPALDATHNWGPGAKGYHWQRTTSAIKQIPVRRFHSAKWLPRFATAMTDWQKPAMTKIKPKLGATGGAKNPCPFAMDQITSCDGSYGNTGWLGLASISFYTATGHIAQGTSKVNNTYFNQAQYNTVAFQQFVICQEIGHNFGLGHVNENDANKNTGSCMDYTSRPAGSASEPNNMHPNTHDYALINTKHNHVGSAALLPGLAPLRQAEMPAALAAYNPLKLSELGTLVARGSDGRTEQYEKDFGGGWKVSNLVIRAR